MRATPAQINQNYNRYHTRSNVKSVKYTKIVIYSAHGLLINFIFLGKINISISEIIFYNNTIAVESRIT